MLKWCVDTAVFSLSFKHGRTEIVGRLVALEENGLSPDDRMPSHLHWQGLRCRLRSPGHIAHDTALSPVQTCPIIKQRKQGQCKAKVQSLGFPTGHEHNSNPNLSFICLPPGRHPLLTPEQSTVGQDSKMQLALVDEHGLPSSCISLVS